MTVGIGRNLAMMGRYLLDSKLEVPFTGGRYTLTPNGTLRDNVSNELIAKDSTGCVEIVCLGSSLKVEFSWVMAVTYKPVIHFELLDALNWTVLFIDGDEKHIHPSNLIWQPPTGGQPCREIDGFYVIPGYTGYAVSMNGQIWSRYSERLLSTRKAKPNIENSYINVSVVSDVGEKTVLGVHRAMGLALLPYTADVWKLTVNHQDGRKWNNVLSNLEWATYSKNNTHAMDLELRKSRDPVKIKDYWTGDVLEFPSMSHAAEYLSMESGHIWYRLNKAQSVLFDYRYGIMYCDSDKPWPEHGIDDLKEQKAAREERLKDLGCAAMNIYTGLSFIAEGPGELARLIGLTKDQTVTGLDSIYKWPVGNHLFWYLKNPKPERVFSEEELIAFKDQFGIRKPVILTKSDGSMQVFVNMSACAQVLNMHRETLRSQLERNGGVTQLNNGSTVKYVVF
jgi:hypothetical protein